MDAVSGIPNSGTPDFVGIVRKAAESFPIKVIATDTGIDPSQVGKVLYKNGTLTLQDFGKLIDKLNKKLVSKDAACVNRKRLSAAATLFGATLSAEGTIEKLIWEDAE